MALAFDGTLNTNKQTPILRFWSHGCLQNIQYETHLSYLRAEFVNFFLSGNNPGFPKTKL